MAKPHHLVEFQRNWTKMSKKLGWENKYRRKIQDRHFYYTRESKKGDTRLLSISSPGVVGYLITTLLEIWYWTCW